MYECVYANVYVSVPVNLYAHVVCSYYIRCVFVCLCVRVRDVDAHVCMRM